KKEKESSKKEFISEAEEILEALTTDIQQLETGVQKNSVKPELINKIFREFHSLKGISGMVGFEKISGFTHELETALDRLRLGKLKLTTTIVDLLFQALDLLNRMVNEISETGAEQSDPSGLLRKINQLLSDQPKTTELGLEDLDLDEQTLKSFTEYEEHRLRENIKKELNLFSIRLNLDSSTFDQELRSINETLSNHGEIISTLPSFDLSVGPNVMVFRLIFGTEQSEKKILEVLQREDIEITRIRAKSRTPAIVDETSEAEKAVDESLKSISHTVRVDIQKLDEVMNVIGELVIVKAVITNLSRQLSSVDTYSSGGLALLRAAAELEKKLNDLQRSVIEMRLVPIGQIYNKLSRMIRKLSRETNKQIEMSFAGEETELDKILIERISDPLIHIIRNAIDHGIESPADRKNSSKPEAGTIKLAAFQRGNNVVIQVQDDGRGIQIKRVQEHARRRGLIPKDHVIDMKECVELIFTPGFSSSEEITELSGRGVGLDVVKKNISELKGTISVRTENGVGTTFEITLPITLAIIQALIVRTAGRKYAIPLSSVSETVRIQKTEIQTVERKEVYYLRDRTVPLIRVSDVFHLDSTNHREKFFAVIVKLGEHSAGLLVEEMLGQQEIVIKTMGEKLKNIPGIAGAAEIGEQKPILVLDAESIVEQATHGKMKVT
ncbi:MAG TPA: chemotaxis protein CheA, partial [Acidobacteriota bacterium]|nr:chemotaxis protein CheA [Acidobacteriota bacterium]